MADDDHHQQRYWFPYWSGQPQQPSRPPVRPQMSRHPSAAPAVERRGGGAAPPPPARAPQVPQPSPSRASPLAPIREPPPSLSPTSNSNAGAAAPPSRPVAAREAAPKLKDVDVDIVLPRDKSIVNQPAAEIKPHGKATDHEEHKAPKDKEETKSKEKVKEKEKEEIKSKEKEKKEEKEKEKEKKKEEKEKEKEKKKEDKEKKHHVGDDGSEDSSGKKKGHGEQAEKQLHTEIKAGVADTVRKASGGGSGHAGSSSVITLAGENKGASMKVGGAGATGKEWRHGHGHRLDGNADDLEEAAAGEGRGGKQGTTTMRALVNSNVQVINNSLMFQSSCSGGDPGVHLKLSATSKSKDKQRLAGDTAAKK